MIVMAIGAAYCLAGKALDVLLGKAEPFEFQGSTLPLRSSEDR